jgi:replicative DNA helicase
MVTAPLTAANADTDTPLGYRELPQNIEAEQALLGSMLINNEVLNQVGDVLVPEHFFEPVHQRLFKAVEHCVNKGLIANPITLKPMFDQDEALKTLGGAHYLVKLAGAASTILDSGHYARIVQDLAIKRQLIGIGEEVVNHAYDAKTGSTATEQLEQVEQKLFALAVTGQSDRSFQPLSVSLSESMERTEAAWKNAGMVNGVTSGFIDLDKLLGGLQNSDLVILAGRPSMGKTALATCMAYNACQALHKKHGSQNGSGKAPSVGFFSLEMSSEQLAGRILASATRINSSKLRRGNLQDHEFQTLLEKSRELSQLPFFIDDTPALSISAMRTRARRLKRQNNLSLIVVDYLQLMRGSVNTGENRVQEISEITQGLKAIAKELQIPVIALSQLSRAVEQRDDKRPQLSDLRESGSIEQDADVVMFVYRDEYYLARKEPREGTDAHLTWQQEMEKVHGIADVIVAKQRHGPIGTVQLQFTSDVTAFGDLERSAYA